MRTVDIPLSGSANPGEFERALDEVCEQLRLRVGTPMSLASHPGSLHWHLKRGDERGTLEVSYVPEPTRLWLAVHSNREGAWIDEAIARLPSLLEQRLNLLTEDNMT